eukprot:scaffold68_cov340-Pavlova_lutheri.AAC.32
MVKSYTFGSYHAGITTVQLGPDNNPRLCWGMKPKSLALAPIFVLRVSSAGSLKGKHEVSKLVHGKSFNRWKIILMHEEAHVEGRLYFSQ